MSSRPCLLSSREPVVVPPTLWETLVRMCECPQCRERVETHARTGSWRLEADGPPPVFTTRAVPTCAICLKPVDRFEERYDRHLGKQILEVTCHGEVQRVTLEESDTVHELGMAFLPDGPPRLP